MSLIINSNVASLTAQRHLTSATDALAGSFAKLSSGLRITRAGDDAAGLAISERMRAQIASLGAAKRNTSDGIGLVQTAEGAMEELNSMLVRMRELAVQAANGTNSAADRSSLDDEFQALVSEVDRVAQATDFGGIQLLDGTTTSISLRVDSGTSSTVDSIDVSLSSARSSDLGLSGLDISVTSTVDAAITAVDGAIASINSQRGDLGAVQNRLEHTMRNLSNRTENLTAAESRIRDVDVAEESARLVRNQILQQAATAMLAQANVQPQAALSLIG